MSESREDDMAKFLFVLSKDENEAATRCFQFAKIAHSKGHHVHLFFIDGGVTWANTARDLTVKTTTGDCPADYLSYLIDNEVEIGICKGKQQFDKRETVRQRTADREAARAVTHAARR